MLAKFLRYFRSLRSMQRVAIALARGAASSTNRTLDPTNPASWEFSGFSQNGEDGIIDVLSRRVVQPNRYFIEIGASDALENNTSWLAILRRFSGLWIEGDQATSDWCKYLFASLNYGVESICMFVTKDNVTKLRDRTLHLNPDVLSLDIDGNDYHVAEAVLSCGIRPKIFIVEYNSAFGPDLSVTIPYLETFRVKQAYGDSLYYGCSIGAWKKLFTTFGYTFITVETNGVNAIFINPKDFDPAFITNIRGRAFAENFSQLREYRLPWNKQFELLSKRSLSQVD